MLLYIYEMVEAITNTIEYFWFLDSRSAFHKGQLYNYRKSATWWTSGAQSYISGQGARVIPLQINSNGVRSFNCCMIYTLKKMLMEQLEKTENSCWSLVFFKRVRCMYQGVIVYDIDSSTWEIWWRIEIILIIIGQL